MKKIALFASLALISLSAYAKDIQELVVTTTPKMSCQNCENKIKGNLRFEKGIKKIETNLKDQRVTIEYDADKTTPAQIEEGFHKIGYNVEVINPAPETSSQKVTSENASSATPVCNGGCCQGKDE